MVSRSVKRFRICMTVDEVVIDIADAQKLMKLSVIVLGSLTRMSLGLGWPFRIICVLSVDLLCFDILLVCYGRYQSLTFEMTDMINRSGINHLQYLSLFSVFRLERLIRWPIRIWFVLKASASVRRSLIWDVDKYGQARPTSLRAYVHPYITSESVFKLSIKCTTIPAVLETSVSRCCRCSACRHAVLSPTTSLCLLLYPQAPLSRP
jgi:hypothetical protein